MKLEDVREAYYSYTGKTSEILRQLGFAGIALIWIFKTDADGKQNVPSELTLPAILITVSLGLDLLQYVTASAIWGIYNRIKEKQGTSNNDEFEAPRPINWLTNILFWAKIFVMVTAYIYIVRFLASKFI